MTRPVPAPVPVLVAPRVVYVAVCRNLSARAHTSPRPSPRSTLVSSRSRFPSSLVSTLVHKRPSRLRPHPHTSRLPRPLPYSRVCRRAFLDASRGVAAQRRRARPRLRRARVSSTSNSSSPHTLTRAIPWWRLVPSPSARPIHPVGSLVLGGGGDATTGTRRRRRRRAPRGTERKDVRRRRRPTSVASPASRAASARAVSLEGIVGTWRWRRRRVDELRDGTRARTRRDVCARAAAAAEARRHVAPRARRDRTTPVPAPRSRRETRKRRGCSRSASASSRRDSLEGELSLSSVDRDRVSGAGASPRRVRRRRRTREASRTEPRNRAPTFYVGIPPRRVPPRRVPPRLRPSRAAPPLIFSDDRGAFRRRVRLGVCAVARALSVAAANHPLRRRPFHVLRRRSFHVLRRRPFHVLRPFRLLGLGGRGRFLRPREYVRNRRRRRTETAAAPGEAEVARRRAGGGANVASGTTDPLDVRKSSDHSHVASRRSRRSRRPRRRRRGGNLALLGFLGGFLRRGRRPHLRGRAPPRGRRPRLRGRRPHLRARRHIWTARADVSLRVSRIRAIWPPRRAPLSRPSPRRIRRRLRR